MATLRSLNIRITANSSDLEKSLARTTLKLKNFSEQATKLGTTLSRSLTLPILGLGGAAVKLFADFEKLEKGLTAVMGSSEAAAKEMALLKEAAKLPGLGFEEAVKGSIRLQAVGLSAEEARKTLATFGAAIAATGGSAANLDSVQYQLSQMISKNRILASDFMIIQDNVPLVGEALEKAFGTKNIENIRDSGISAKEFNARLVEVLATMPKVQAASGGLGNAFDNFKDSLKFAAIDVGRMIADSIDLEGALNKIVEAVERAVEWFKSLSAETKQSIIGWTLFAAAIGPVIFAVGKIASVGAMATKSIFGMIQILKSGGTIFAVITSSVTLTVAAIASLGLAALYVYKNWEAFKTNFGNVWKQIVWSAKMGVNGVLEKLNKLQESLGINIWKFDIEPINAGDIFEMKSFMTMGDFIKDIGRDLAGLVGIQSKAAGSILAPTSTDTATTTDTDAGTGGATSKGWAGAAVENLEKVKAGYEGMALGIKSAGDAHAEMTMKMAEGIDGALTTMQEMAMGLADSFSSLAESGATSMSDLSKAVVSEIRKMIVAKIKLGVASAIGEKLAAGPFGIFLAAGAGLAASAIFSRILGGLKIPALAKGGAAFGPTLAMVGDNPNAMSDPELIMPFSKMKKMILNDIIGNRQGTQEIRLATSAIEIDGRKLRILLEQENNYVRGLR